METRLLDLQDDAELARAYDLFVASHRVGRPWHESMRLAEALLQWRHVDPSEASEMWGAFDAGEIVGVGCAWLSLDDNVTKMIFSVDVHPDHRRQGVGGALVERLVERARANGRVEMLVQVFVPPDDEDHPYLRFARGHGLHRTSTDVWRYLPLPVEEDLLDRVAEGARPHWEGRYRLERHRGGLPEPLQESFCVLLNLLGVDAPTGDVEYEPETYTPARYRENLRRQREAGQDRLSAIAVETATGQVVAYTDLVLPAAPNPVVWQWGTYVHRDHRGHRLGSAVKADNLRQLAAVHPERERVVAANDETNGWMVDINLTLGFTVRELGHNYRLLLT